jgi:hypothetical protein
MYDELVRAGMWAVATVSAVIVSMVALASDAAEAVGAASIGTALLGTGGLVGLVALMWKLATDYRSSSHLLDTYRDMLDSERSELTRLREELRRCQARGFNFDVDGGAEG